MISIAKVLVLAGSLLFLALGTLFVLRSRGQQDQQIEVKSVKWKPAPGELRSVEVLGHSLTNADVERLRQLGLSGTVTFASSGIYGSEAFGTNKGKPQASVLIVLQRPVKEPVNLAQPDQTTVIYIQSDEGWRLHPSDAKTLQRKIRLSPDPRHPESATLYMVDHPDGSRQGGTLITW